MSRRRTGCCPGSGCGTTVNRALLPIKAAYFLLFAAVAVLHPYVPVYMKALGLTPSETAIILTVVIAGSGIARGLFGALADAYNKHALLMSICCVLSAAAHVCLYFTPPVNRNGASNVTHDFTATLSCSEGRMAICVIGQDPGSYGGWNGSRMEWNQTGGGLRVGVTDSCSIQCCSMVGVASRSGGQSTLTSERVMGEPVSFRKDGQSTGTTTRRTSEGDPAAALGTSSLGTSFPSTPSPGTSSPGTSSSSTSSPSSSSQSSYSQSTSSSRTESFEVPRVAATISDPSVANLSVNSCGNFTNLTFVDSNSTSAFKATNCTSVWIVDLLANLTGDSRTCDATDWTYSSCTIRCDGFDPYGNASGKEGSVGGEEAQYGTTFVLCFISFFVVLFFLCPIFSIADSLVYAILGENGKDFGQVRLWGTVSMGIFALLSGLAMDAFANAGVENVYMYPFIACVMFLLVSAVLIITKSPKLPVPPTVSTPDAPLPVYPLFPGMSNGKSSSLVTLGSQLGQVGVTSFPSSNGFNVFGSTTNESQQNGDIRGSFVLIPQGELEKFAAVKCLGDSGTLVAVIPQKSKELEEFTNRKSPNGEQLGNSVLNKSPNPGDPAESVPLKSTTPGDLGEAAPALDPESSPPSSNMSRNFILLLSDPIIVIVFITVLIAGVILGQHNAFFFWYLKTLGANQLLLGLNIVVCCISEIALLFCSGRIIEFVGYRLCLYLVFAVYGVRLLVNSFILNPWIALATEMTQSLCNGLLFPAASLCVNALAPAGMHGTVQGIIGALHWSVGVAIGTAIAGRLYEAIGPQSMFQIFAGVSLVYGALLAVTMETLHRRTRKKTTKKEPDLELNVDSSAPVQLPKSNGNGEPVANHHHDDESSPMMLHHPQQPSQPPKHQQ